MNKRLLAIRKALKLNQTDFGKKLGLSTAAVSALESGQRNLTDRHMLLLASELNVNEQWLRDGDGEMFMKADKFSLDAAASESGLTDLEKSIMYAYMSLSKGTRKEIVSKLKDALNEKSTVSAEKEVIDIDEEILSYRLELEQEKKMQTSSVLHESKESY